MTRRVCPGPFGRAVAGHPGPVLPGLGPARHRGGTGRGRAGRGHRLGRDPAGGRPGRGARHRGAGRARPSGGWCKIIGDWAQDEPPVPLDVLRAAVRAVHGAGGKVAVHCQTAMGCANAVAAGADSLEHGMHLDPALLDQMAAQGTALVPTLNAFAAGAFRVRAQAPSPRRDAFLRGWAALPGIARAAHEAGVTVLAGTDTHPCGTVAQEVERLISAGLPRAAALGAACWTARSWLGLPGLADGAPGRPGGLRRGSGRSPGRTAPPQPDHPAWPAGDLTGPAAQPAGWTAIPRRSRNLPRRGPAGATVRACGDCRHPGSAGLGSGLPAVQLSCGTSRERDCGTWRRWSLVPPTQQAQ